MQVVSQVVFFEAFTLSGEMRRGAHRDRVWGNVTENACENGWRRASWRRTPSVLS